MSVPFVGRDEELRALLALISGARQAGAPTAALVTGEPGSGKSRLLREVLDTADRRRTVMVAGFEPIASVPLGAVGDLVRRLDGVPGAGAKLDALVFGTVDQRGGSALPVFETAHRAIAAFGPLVIAVDDLQWVDTQSMALLQYLIRAAESTRQPLVVLAASRPSANALSFIKAIEGPLPEGRRNTIELRGLAKSDGVALVRAIDSRIDDRAAEDLWRRASGSPFWLDALSRKRGARTAVELVGDRLATLSADSGRLVGALAVVARPAARDELAELLAWTQPQLDHAVQETVARGLASELPGAVRLAHDLIREAAFETVPAASRRATHERLASIIESSAGDDLGLLAEALEHRAAAGLPTADIAARMLRSPQRRLLSLDGLKRIGSISDELEVGSATQLSLDRDVGKLAGLIGEQTLSMHHWLRVAARDPDELGRQRAAWEAALAAFRLGRAAEAHAHLELAASVAPASSEAQMRIEAVRAEVALWLDHDTQAGAAAAARALSAGGEMIASAAGLDRLSPDSRYAYLSALLASIGASMQQERFDDAKRLTDQSLAVARDLDDESLVEALLRGGFALRPLGAVQETERLYREAWNIAHRAVLPFAMIDAGIGLTRVLRDLGRLVEARRVAEETVELEKRLGTPPGRWGNAIAGLHLVEVAQGEASGLDRLRGDARTHPNPHFRLSLHVQIAAWQARVGGRRYAAEVGEELAAAESDAELAGCPRCAGELAVISAELLARLGRIDEARERLEVWEQRPIADYPMRRLWRASARASIAAAEDDRVAAGDMLDGLAEAYRRAGLDDDLLWVHLDRGALRARFDRAGAVEAYTAAADLAGRTGATSRGRIAAKALRELGVRAWRRSAAGADNRGIANLSTREQEVAALVASGASNREIAERLVLSPKTVERHITNILAKMGARNRTELAALVHSSKPGI